jgi:5-hydroxyisourate hydrolase-like protein (transthyretin family)
MSTAMHLDKLPAETVGLRLYRIDSKENLIGCEAVTFRNGRAGVNTVLRRAAIAGLVEVGGDIKDHFADVLDERLNLIETVALDAASYRSLKIKWMPCKVDRP